ncbi:unnamed protein product [Durusdinium trenchii]|uniref:Uncharacterized protein n=1 Tax=Durusdinium trenchii TaxID=1381693 RepID=A0ABP0I1G5_9DINO
MPTPTSTVGEMKDMFATMRFIATLRCGESTWCAKAAPLKSLRMVSSEDIWRQLHASQNPERCEDARYLIYHDDRSTSGFGWNAFLLFSAFLQAFLEERVLVEAAAVTDRDHRRWRQRWCSDPPYSMKCFFRSWSKCERPDVWSKVTQNGLEKVPDWQNVETAGQTNSTCTCNEPHVIWRASRRSDDVFFPSIVAKGRYWWYAAMVQLLMSPLPWLEDAANTFLTAHGLDSQPFVVAAVRRGNKSVEVPYVHVREFTNQLRAFKVPLDPSFARARVGVGAECARLAGRNAFLLCGRKEEMLLVERSGGLVHMGSATQFNRSSVDFPEFTHPFRRSTAVLRLTHSPAIWESYLGLVQECSWPWLDRE